MVYPVSRRFERTMKTGEISEKDQFLNWKVGDQMNSSQIECPQSELTEIKKSLFNDALYSEKKTYPDDLPFSPVKWPFSKGRGGR